ncbi:hypothetical protein [Photobacterium chitinilyticum]|uniref:Uncharacterized protein n=1 Tax=Photobacterium chitinilyticum TaxID=2485123 RepID=A0A444JJ82_9GAMM|nr:hypothetical protein [Photobacterium chitinilyticum]RWX53114.1 hypothetical protein EDI28_23475 [Photobacterium chitinilyticum]
MSDLNQFHAQLELQHIYLEVYAERFHYLRPFFEGYYCYRHQLVTRQGKADWEQIFDHGVRSKAASQITNRKQLVRELRLPLAVLIGKLKVLVRDDELSLDAIQCLLDNNLEYTILTRDEFQRLKAAGMLDRMPAEYYRQGSANYQCTGARFDAVGIQFLD